MYGRILNEKPTSLITPTAYEIGQPFSLTKISVMPKTQYEVKSKLKNGKLVASRREIVTNQTYASEPTVDMGNNHPMARIAQINKTMVGYKSF